MTNSLKTNSFILFLLLILSSKSNLAQKRIGFELSTNSYRMNGTVHYQKMYKPNWLVSVGIFGGGHGFGGLVNSEENQANLLPIHVPFGNIDQQKQIDNSTYFLNSYRFIKNNAFGVQFGLGWFHEFNVIHGFRANIHLKTGVSRALVRYTYLNENTFSSSFLNQSFHHFGFVGFVPEVAHTIRVGNKWTLYYGLKCSFFTTMAKTWYNPRHSKEAFYGPELELKMGLTRSIGEKKGK